jgi:hypothetical protein
LGRWRSLRWKRESAGRAHTGGRPVRRSVWSRCDRRGRLRRSVQPAEHLGELAGLSGGWRRGGRERGRREAQGGRKLWAGLGRVRMEKPGKLAAFDGGRRCRSGRGGRLKHLRKFAWRRLSLGLGLWPVASPLAGRQRGLEHAREFPGLLRRRRCGGWRWGRCGSGRHRHRRLSGGCLA